MKKVPFVTKYSARMLKEMEIPSNNVIRLASVF